MTRARYVPAVIFCGLCLAGQGAMAQVDPEWLRSWTESQQQRPTKLSSIGRIASADEPGQAMVIRGRVLGPDGAAAGGVTVHSYHRDTEGFEFGADDQALTTWRLQGWAITDAGGRFEFATIRPAPDALGREAAHVHLTVVSKQWGRQWAPKVFLTDDPLVTDRQRRASAKLGRFGGVRDVVIEDGVHYVDVEIALKPAGDF